MITITSANIKQLIESNPNQLFIISKKYTGDDDMVCKYLGSWRSITEFEQIETGIKFNILRGHMKFVSKLN